MGVAITPSQLSATLHSLTTNDAFALARIWDQWLNEGDARELKDAFFIIATETNPAAERVHNTVNPQGPPSLGAFVKYPSSRVVYKC